MSKNTKQVQEDFLEEDNEIPGQRFCLLSFLSPEKILARKDQFFFEQFLKDYEIQWKTKNLEKFLANTVLEFNTKLEEEAARLEKSDLSGAADICRSSRIRVDTVLDSYQSFIKSNAKEITNTKIKESYDDFIFSHGKKLEEQFHAKNNFQTTVRGLKIRGSYGTQEEATARAKKLQRQDTIHNIYVAEVGKWLAWDPNPNEVADQEYADDQLNMLMKAYKENEEQREEFYNKNPEAKKGGKGAGRSEKEIMSIVGPTEETSQNEMVSTGEHASLFEGSVDLALQRKMEAANKKKEE